jgi:hypothetical protein
LVVSTTIRQSRHGPHFIRSSLNHSDMCIMIQRIYLLVALLAVHSYCTFAKVNFVKMSSCTWTKRSKCGPKQSSSIHKIDLHVMTKSGPWSNRFPREIKQSARIAANTWLRAIRGRPARADWVDLPWRCGPSMGTTSMVGDLAICIVMDDEFPNDATAIATAGADSVARSDRLPRVVVVRINTKFAGEFDRCDWNNILMHELGHALGFTREIFLKRGLYYRRNRNRHHCFLARIHSVNGRQWED